MHTHTTRLLMPAKSRENTNAHRIEVACSNSDSPMSASGRWLVQRKIIAI